MSLNPKIIIIRSKELNRYMFFQFSKEGEGKRQIIYPSL